MPHKIEHIMTSDPTCVTPNETVQQAAQMMRRENVGSLPVVDNHNSKRIVGMITDRDIAIRVVSEGNDGSTPVQQAMTSSPVCARADQDVETVARLMAEHQVRRIPVVDRNDCVVGIVAQADLALKTEDQETTAGVVEEISEPSTQHSQGQRGE